MSNTSQDEVQVEAPVRTEIVDQETLDQALSQDEPAEEVEESTEEANTEQLEEKPEQLEEKSEKLYMGKYRTEADMENAFKSIQAEYTKTSQELKQLRQEQKTKELESVKSLGYDEQMEVLLNRIQELEAQQGEQSTQYSELQEIAAMEQDAIELENFIKTRPELVETGMDDIFRTLAQHPDLRNYTFESIYNAKMKPKLEKLMGTKIKVKERPLHGQTKAPSKPTTDVSAMSPSEYEKHRATILQEAGIKI